MNLVGTRTLFSKEIQRFWNVWIQTVVSPAISTALYFLVFGVALGGVLKDAAGLPYAQYVVPGLMMLAMVNAAFANTSFSLFQSKIMGTLVDVLVAPMGPAEILLAYTAAAVVRALAVAVLVWIVSIFFAGAHLAHPLHALYFGLAPAATFALLGLVIAVWAEKYDHLTALPTFVITPLVFVGGVFYPVSLLPAPWDYVSQLNPMVHMVSGLRYGIVGVSDVPLTTSWITVTALFLFSIALAWRVLASGYKLRS
jgi:ABC-2 type transport system permease protein